MRRTVLAAVTAFIVGGAATGAILSHAQPAPQPGPQSMDGGPMMHRMMGSGSGPGAVHRPFGPRTFALIYRQADRQLSPADVQKIAEAFLLWNGNHSWKVTEVASTADGPVGFSLSTPEGSVVAKFTMDPHSGRIARIG